MECLPHKSEKCQISFSPVLVTFSNVVTKYFDKSHLKKDGVLLAHGWRDSPVEGNQGSRSWKQLLMCLQAERREQ